MRRSATILLATSLAACGAGTSGSGSSTQNLASAPGNAALTAYLQTSNETSLQYTDSGGNVYKLAYALQPSQGSGSFDGHTGAYSALKTITVTSASGAVASAAETDYFTLDPLMPLGTVYGSGTGIPYAVAASSAAIPATIDVGGAGPFVELNIYHDSSKGTVEGTLTDTYSVEPGNSTSLLLCFNAVTSNVTAQGITDGLSDGTETDCYSIDAAGTATLASITLTSGGQTIEFLPST